MSIIHLAASPEARMSAAAATAAVTLMTLYMSIRLSRRHRAYRLLIAGLALAIIQQLLAWNVIAAIYGSGANLAAESASALSFLIINAAALELYSRPSRLDRLLVYLLAALIPAAWSLQSLPLSGSAGELLPPGGLIVPALHAAGVLAAILFLAQWLPRVGQQRTYGLSLTAYLLANLALLAGDLSGPQPHAALAGAVQFLEAGYMLLLLLFVFEGMLERLKSVYASSIRDALTGLYTRQHFLRKAERYRRRGFKVAVLFCDIDNFKRLNDTEGHQAADEVLKRVASILSEETRSGGTAGRFGGEELVAAIAHPKIKPGAVAESVRRRVEAETPVTVSIGWSAVGSGGTLDEALKHADEAMYKSKHSGKNKVTAHREPAVRAAAPPQDDATRGLGG